MPRKYTPKVKCSAKGGTCRRAAIRGGTVCQYHGGGAPQVKAKADWRLKEGLYDLIDPDRTIREAVRLARSDVRQLFDEKGNMKPVKDWPDGLAAAIGGIEVVRRNVDSKDGKTDDILKVKVWDKPRNLELLFKALGLLEHKQEVEGDVTVTVKWQS